MPSKVIQNKIVSVNSEHQFRFPFVKIDAACEPYVCGMEVFLRWV